MSVWPPYPPEPPQPRRTPWQPGPAAPVPAPPPVSPPVSPPLSPGRSVVVDPGPDWLVERLAAQRLVVLAGELDRDAANRAVAALALLDASGDEPVALRLSGVSADLDSALTLVDTLDMMGVEVHATCLGTLTGAAVAVLAVADRRVAAPHAWVHLCAPRPQGAAGRDLEAYADHHGRQLRLLQERIAVACGRPVEAVADDMRAGRVLTAGEAREYGLVDTVRGRASRSPGP